MIPSFLFGVIAGVGERCNQEILGLGENSRVAPPLIEQRLRMKYYVCLFACAAIPLVWGSDSTRLKYRVETVAGSARIGDGGSPLAAQFSSIQGVAIDRF